MTDVVTFLFAALALLATPGPTNTLLATSGATRGFGRSLGLLAGELSGYLLAIAILIAAIGPIVATMPAFGLALSAAITLYLIRLAWVLWNDGGHELIGERPVTLGRVFLTTLLNPKAIVFAFTLLPSRGAPELLPWLGLLSALIVLVGTCWIAVGAGLKQGARGITVSRLAHRAGAVVLAVFAALIGATALAKS